MKHLPSGALRHEYAALAPDYESRWRRYLETTHARALAALAPQPGERILDVGCGTGLLLARLLATQTDLRLAGVDVSDAMLARARARLPSSVRLAETDAGRLPFEDGAFDAVVSTSMLHHLDDPAPPLAEAARTLASGGRLVVTDWCRDFLAMRLLDAWRGRRHYPPNRTLDGRELVTLAETTGFRVEKIERFRILPAWGMMTLSATRQ